MNIDVGTLVDQMPIDGGMRSVFQCVEPSGYVRATVLTFRNGRIVGIEQYDMNEIMQLASALEMAYHGDREKCKLYEGSAPPPTDGTVRPTSLHLHHPRAKHLPTSTNQPAVALMPSRTIRQLTETPACVMLCTSTQSRTPLARGASEWLKTCPGGGTRCYGNGHPPLLE